jgi:hypothetical protein
LAPKAGLFVRPILGDALYADAVKTDSIADLLASGFARQK